MAREVIWSFEAAGDLDALAAYIARDSVSYAAAFTQRILEISRTLNESSERGREFECTRISYPITHNPSPITKT